jgi:hypothetical protein
MKNNDYNINDEPSLPLDNNDQPSFGLPLDYFSSFEDKLRKKMDLEDELENYPSLSAIKKNNAFSVPLNYFQESLNTIEIKSELIEFTKLQSINPLIQTNLEEDYLTQLKTSINYKIELVEELKEYKNLFAVNKENSFFVADNYFESLADSVKEKIHSKQLDRESILSKILELVFGKRMAFAFGLIAIFTLGIYFYKTTEPVIESSDCKTLACLERQEILSNTKAISNFDDDQLMDLVDVNSLNKQLNTTKENSNTKTEEKLNLDSISEEDLLEEL